MDETINYADKSFTPGEAVVEQVQAILEPPHPERKLGLALVGLGDYSTKQLAPALEQTKFCKLAGLVTGSPSNLAEWKSKYGIPDSHIYNYDNFDEISGNTDIDIVYIVLPNAMHAEYVIRAAKAGKHVICEKPMALSVSECDKMIAACKEAGKMLGIGYRLHYDPYHIEVMKLGQDKVFGELSNIHAQHGSNDTEGWRLDKELAGGGALMDLGIYCIQAARYVAGQNPVAVKALEWTPQNVDKGGIETFIAWEMDFPNGLVAKCEAGYNGVMNLLHATGEHGWFELSPAFSYKGITGKTAVSFLDFPMINQQALQMDDFALSILQNKPVKLSGELGKHDIKVIEAIYESMISGKKIDIG
jgi:predicted dehydrogenase